MEELKYLVEVVNRDKVKKIEIIGDTTSNPSKLNQLYNALLEGKFKSDKEAAEYFFPNTKNSLKQFSNLKGLLRNRLINTIFFIDIKKPNYKDIQRAYYTCYKQTAAVQILLGKTARVPAISLAQKTLKKALEFEFTDLALELATIMRRNSGMKGDRKNFILYNDLVNELKAKYNDELLAEEYYMDLLSEAAISSGYKASTINKAKTYFEALVKINHSRNTHKFQYFKYLVIIARFELENDYKSILKYSTEAIKELSKKPHLSSPKRLAAFILRKLVCHLHFKNFLDAEKGIIEYQNIISPGTRNWYIILTYEIKLAILKKNYEKALNIYRKVVSNDGINRQSPDIKEIWKIHEAYIFFFEITGKIDSTAIKEIKKFRVSKFLNEVPLYSKDKRGQNINILILQVLFLLNQRKYDQIIDRMESLKMYTHRYLRKDDSFRSNCFIKMLIQLPKASFHKAAVLRKTEKLRHRLDEKPIELANQSAELEIVPYEYLWQLVLEQLDNRFH